MKATMEREIKVHFLAIKGRWDANTDGIIKSKLKTLVNGQRTHLVLDLQQVHFMDSSGLGSLVACYRMVAKTGGDIKLCSLNPQIQNLVELTRLNQLFDIFETPEQAKRSFM